jgi:enoyl-CoA hydratase/carnithine racemase
MADQGPVLSERRGPVGIAYLNRPDARNALSSELMDELATLLEAWDADDVIAGSDQYFAAGGDIKMMAERGFQDFLTEHGLSFWERVAAVKKPLVAAVSGYALGGGCELALLGDVVVASETAEFGQPEIMLGVIPGGGGTQRLTRVMGKQQAMELVLTGRRIDAEEAHRLGLVNVVARKKEWLDRAVELASVVASRAPLAAQMAKKAVLAADEVGLAAGLETERRLFELALATEDRHEGMAAFIEKRKPDFKAR